MKRPPTPKIPLDTGRKLVIHGRKIMIRGRVRYFRKDSNEELLHQAILKKGVVRLSMKIQIRDPRHGNYLGWHGWSPKVDVTSVAQAAQFATELEHAIARVASNIGAKFTSNKETLYGNARRRISKDRHQKTRN